MNVDNKKLDSLQCAFPKLTEVNQHYVLGLAEGLKRAQNGQSAEPPKTAKAGTGKEGK